MHGRRLALVAAVGAAVIVAVVVLLTGRGTPGGRSLDFHGSLDGYFTPPSPLPSGKPGDLIRTQPVNTFYGIVTTRIMYHSTDSQGHDRAVTGSVSYPLKPAPSGGWPVIATAPGTAGLTTKCAPSRGRDAVDGYGVEGVHVQTDYIGMVAGERQPYLDGVAEAYALIDAVRAARNIPEAHAGKRWVAYGFSQGGHAALFTNQLATTYAPELDLIGAVAGAPPSSFARSFGPTDRVIPSLAMALALYGVAPTDKQIRPADYLNAWTMRQEPILVNGCVLQSINHFLNAPGTQYFAHDPATTSPASRFFARNEPGQTKGSSPLLLFTGTTDSFIVPKRVDALNQRLCDVGQVTKYVTLQDANHATEPIVGARMITRWIADRFAGKPAPNTCPAAH